MSERRCDASRAETFLVLSSVAKTQQAPMRLLNYACALARAQEKEGAQAVITLCRRELLDMQTALCETFCFPSQYPNTIVGER